MWYYELWCEESFVCKSEFFETKEKAVLDAEKRIEEEMRNEYEEKGCRTRGDYSAEYYWTGEEE